MKQFWPFLFSLKIAVPLSLGLFSTSASAATVVWTNTGSGNWSAATNWSPNTVPASGDTVFITNAGTYVVTVDANPTLGGLTVGGTTNGAVTLNLNSGTLTLNGGSSFATNTVFNLGGGTLAGSGTVTFRGGVNWTSGTMSDVGKTIFASTATVNLSSANPKVWRQRTIENYAAVTYTGGGFYADLLGVWNNQSGASFTIAGDFPITYYGAAGYCTFNNAGTFRKSTGSGTAAVQLTLNNSSAVQASTGFLSLDAGGVSSGLFQAAPGGTNNFGGGTHTLVTGARFEGAGLFEVVQNSSGSTLAIATPLTITNRFLLHYGGVLAGTNTVTFAGPFDWLGGNQQDTGKTIFASTATVNLSSANPKVWRQRTIENYAAVTYTGGGFYADLLGVWNNQSGSSFTIAGDFPITYYGAAGYCTFNNAGTFRKSTGSGTAAVQLTLNNSGAVQAYAGFLSLDAGGVSSGLFQAAPGGTNNFGGGTHTLVAGARFEGAGLFEVVQNSSGSTLAIATPLTITNRFLLHYGGVLGGTNVVTFAGPFDWAGGNQQDTGKTIFASTATVNLSSANPKVWRQRTIENYAAVTYTGGGFYADLLGVWNNQSGSSFTIAGDFPITYYGAAGYCTFNNAGTFRKSTGSGTAAVQLTLNNSGAVQAYAGFLSLDAGGVSSGLFQAAPGGTNNFGGGTHTLVTGARFEGAGLFEVAQNSSGSTLAIATPLTITNRFLLHYGGVLAGTNTVTFAGPFDWLGGNQQDTGKTIFASTATVNLSGANPKVWRQRTIENYAAVTYTGGGFYADLLGVWNNQSGSSFTIAGDFPITYYGAAGYCTFNNAGTFRKSTGSGMADVQLQMRNTVVGSVVRSQSGTLGFSVSFVQTNGLTELAGGNFSGTLFDLRGGLLTGAGNIAGNVLNNAHIAPGSGVGQITISNNVPQTYSGSSGTLTFEVGGLTPVTGHDRLRVNNGTATLGGTLRAVLANGYIPTSGNTYTVMTFTARSGVFTNYSFPDYEFGVVQTSTNVILVASNALPALQLSGVPSNQLVCVPFRLRTAASDLDGTITNLSVLFGTNVIASFPSGSSQSFEFTYDFPGTTVFTARAYDNKGAIRETNVTTTYYTLPLHVLNLGGKVEGGAFKFCMLGEAGSNYMVLSATNVDQPPDEWVPLGTMESTNGIWRYFDEGTVTNRPMRFYRALRQ